MAFLIREDKVINSTVGWDGYLFLFLFIVNYISIIYNISILGYTKSGNLLDTFCSLNSNRNAQSAGNLCLTTIKEWRLRRFSRFSKAALLLRTRTPRRTRSRTLISLDFIKKSEPEINEVSTQAAKPPHMRFGLAVKVVKDKQGSSETMRENTYDLFKKNFAYFFKQEFNPSPLRSAASLQKDND